jgi:hypothetical protein
MWPVNYGGPVSGQARDPLEWFPLGSSVPLSGFATLNPGLGARGSSGGGCFQGRRFPPPAHRRALVARGFSLVRSLTGGPQGLGILSPTRRSIRTKTRCCLPCASEY